jgi:hypothetical protein
MNFYYIHKYHQESCVKIRIAKTFDNHNAFIKHMRCFERVDDFQFEVPESCIKRLLPKHDWADAIVYIEMPNGFVGKSDDYMKYVVEKLRKQL